MTPLAPTFSEDRIVQYVRFTRLIVAVVFLEAYLLYSYYLTFVSTGNNISGSTHSILAVEQQYPGLQQLQYHILHSPPG